MFVYHLKAGFACTHNKDCSLAPNCSRSNVFSCNSVAIATQAPAATTSRPGGSSAPGKTEALYFNNYWQTALLLIRV